MDEILLAWAENIRLHREVLELTQAEVARAVGVSAAAISRWEKGISEPTRHHKAKLAGVLKTDARILFPLRSAA